MEEEVERLQELEDQEVFCNTDTLDRTGKLILNNEISPKMVLNKI